MWKLLFILSILVTKCAGTNPFVMPLKQFSPLSKSEFIGLEPRSNLYVASNDDDNSLKGIFVKSGNITISLDTINTINDNGSAKSFSLIDGLTISTTNNFSTSDSLSGFIYVTTKKQADDPKFSVYVIKANHTINIPESNSTVVVLNTALGSSNIMDPLKTSRVTNMNLSPDNEIHMHYGYPPVDWNNKTNNRFFNNPIYLESYDKNGHLLSTKTFFSTVEPLQINADYWYFTASGPISMRIENKYIEDLVYNATSLNTTGVIINDGLFQEHIVNFEMDYSREKMVGMSVSLMQVSDLTFYFLAEDSLFSMSYNNNTNATENDAWAVVQATRFVVNSTSPIPGTFYCQYFVYSGDLIPTTTAKQSSTTTVPFTTITVPSRTSQVTTPPTTRISTSSQATSPTGTTGGIPTMVTSTTSHSVYSSSTAFSINTTTTTNSTTTPVPTTTKFGSSNSLVLGIVTVVLGLFFCDIFE